MTYFLVGREFVVAGVDYGFGFADTVCRDFNGSTDCRL
jgi:hypothetical protein